MAAVPRRGLFYSGKLAVLAALALPVGLATGFGCFLGGADVPRRVRRGPGRPGTLRSAVGCGLYLTLLTLFSAGVAAVVRSQVGALSLLTPVVFLISPVLGSISAIADVTAFLPDRVGQQILHPAPEGVLGAWDGMGGDGAVDGARGRRGLVGAAAPGRVRGRLAPGQPASAAARSRPNSSAIFGRGPMGVQAAGVGQRPDADGAYGALLRADLRVLVAEGDAVGGHTDHRQPAGPQQLHLLGEDPPALAELDVAQLVRAGRGPRDDVGDAEAVAEQLPLLGQAADAAG
ncbi:hypothetical protein GCM10020000_09340 [Streptomyces olivoverticillatus]